MKICVIGQGYIGIPTAVLFAKNNCQVIGVDINETIVSNLNKGNITIEEPKIKEILKTCLENGTYMVKTHPEESNVYIITVPTPFKENSFECDLKHVISACESIIPYIKKEDIIIIESTIAPLSTETVIKPLFEKEGYVIGEDLYLAHCPERVLPGNILEELVHNSRIIGGITPQCTRKATEVYKIFVEGEIIETEAKIAELSKCMENTYRDVNIALANELVKIGAKLDINVLEVIEIANKHPRVNILSPGPGVGGHCIAIDPYFVYSLAQEEAKIIKMARDTNKSMPDFVVKNVKNILNDYKENKHIISIFGLAYKGNSDDDRESPSYDIIRGLEKDFDLKIYDPHIKFTNLSFEEAIQDSSLLLILTNHDEFKELDFNKLKENMKQPIIFDTKNIIDKNDILEEITLFNFGNLPK
ncbi:nucleotide sugar dehydrogenase [Methanosphaera sp. WGK6]|uniref:nucleotide sugar dehydrogenase n=1 Tax=Methanosphaera sp. WGK6 TaxID=1561964 RepID=UPI00084C7F78|nr:nucleotide sugar dehydrogenase [Methanosphaera sp. WGK6]OED29970.1 UDP-N-acetyl-D-mannosamine dehydrogenase [Methanosphaera sp. WGK6]